MRDLQKRQRHAQYNGQPVQAAVLTPGDVISIGMTTLKYLVNDEQETEWLTEDDVIYDEPMPVQNSTVTTAARSRWIAAEITNPILKRSPRHCRIIRSLKAISS